MAEVTSLRNCALPYPVYSVPYGVTFPILDADGDTVTSASSLDSEVSKNGDTFADCTNEATEIGSTGIYYLLLTGAEMTADVVTVQVKTGTSGAKTTILTLYPRKLVSLRTGTAQGGAAGYITLDASAGSRDDRWNGCLVVGVLDSATEARIITDYTGSNQQAAVTPNWNTTPDSDDTFTIYLPEGMQNPTANVSHVNETAQTAQDLGAINVTNLNTLSGHDPGATLGTSTLTQTQVTGGAYALNSSSFAFNSALDLTTTQKSSVTTAATAATPTAAAVTGNVGGNVTGSVGSVVGNVGGNVTGSVGSISGITFPTNFSSILINSSGHISRVTLTDTITTYTGNTPQTGDAYAYAVANVGANGANLTAADDAVLAAIAALNNLSSAGAQTAVTAALTAALTEGYRGTGATGSVRDLLYEIIAHLGESSISSTTKTLKKLDGSTTAKTYTLDDATTPTAITEAT